MVSKLLPLLPRTRIYVEAFGGAASLMCARAASPVEVFNDLDGRLVNLFRVLQQPSLADRLRHRLERTLYSRREFVNAIESASADPVDRAFAFFILQNQGFAGIPGRHTRGNWGRSLLETPSRAGAFRGQVARFADYCDRFSHVQVDEADAVATLKFWDTADTLFYCDPPYVGATRAAGYDKVYLHEYSDAQHRDFLRHALLAKGAVAISGYDSPLYAPLTAAGWDRTTFAVTCSAAGRVRGSHLRGNGAASRNASRTEVLWRNPRCMLLVAEQTSRPTPVARGRRAPTVTKPPGRHIRPSGGDR